MGLTITPGRTWVTGETVTAAKLNNSFTAATVDYSAYQDALGTFNAASGDFVWVAEGDQVNLPTSPNDNDVVTVAQASGDFVSTSATVSAGSKNINFNDFNGVAENATLVLNTNFIGSLVFTFNDSEDVWKLT